MRKVPQAIVIGWIGLFSVGFGAGHAQSVNPGVIHPRSTSPFEIARVINQGEAQWNVRLEPNGPTNVWSRPGANEQSKWQWRKKREIIPVDLKSTWQRLGIAPGSFETCQGECEARIFRLELDKKPGKEVLLKLSRQWDTCRYLIFSEVGTRSRRWKFLGYIDHDFNRYEMARHHRVQAFAKNWLVIRGQEGSGSGYYLGGETWFEVSNRGVRPVLNYSIDGRTDPGSAGLKWDLKSHAIPLTNSRTHSPTIKLSFVVTYTAQGFEESDFTRRFVNRRKAYYVWNKRSREFVIDRRRSTISEHEMNLVANVETEPALANQGVKIGESTFFSGLKGFVGSGFEMFLRLNIHRLMRIAHGSNSRAKEWLRAFLKQCDDIPEKVTLDRALQDWLPQSRKQR